MRAATQRIKWKRQRGRTLDMDREHPQKAQRDPHRTLKITLLIILWTPMNMVGCSRQQPKATPESQQASASKSNTEAEVRLTCPPGDPPDNDVSSSPVGSHAVSLSWNPSTSANNPKGGEIRYCVYRTKGGRVQRSASARSLSPCINCQRVTKEPVTVTTYNDTYVENDSHYCYVAISIEAVSSTHSDFSNQTQADIPKGKAPPSNGISSGSLCELKGQNYKSTPNRGHR